MTVAAVSGEEGNSCAEHTTAMAAKRREALSAVFEARLNIKLTAQIVDATY